MNFYNNMHPYYCGIDLHARLLYVCIIDNTGLILVHALYMKAIHGGKAKNDKIDSFKIAKLIRGGNFPLAYVYDKEMRATRDLLRRGSKINVLVQFKLIYMTHNIDSVDD